MSEETKNQNPEKTPRLQGGKGSSVQRLILPRRGSASHKLLGKYLDIILEEIDYNSIHLGFCKRKTKTLDRSLALIEKAAKDGRQLLRKNV